MLRDALEHAKLHFIRINSRQARDFAHAMGAIGKTDRVDSRMLTKVGTRLSPPHTEPMTQAIEARVSAAVYFCGTIPKTPEAIRSMLRKLS